MAPLVEDVVSLEKEADSIVARARAEAKESEKLAFAEAEAYRRKRVEEMAQKVSAFQKEAEEKHRRSVAETEMDLARALSSIDEVPDVTLKEQIDKIVARFGDR